MKSGLTIIRVNLVLLAVLLVTHVSTVFAGVLYPACVAGCGMYCLAGLGFPNYYACVVFCIQTCPRCFSDNTTFTVCHKEDYIKDSGLCGHTGELSKTIYVKDLKAGDFVNTLPISLQTGNGPTYTEVVKNTKSSGGFTFIHMQLGDVGGDAADNLEVTTEHYIVVLVQGDDNDDNVDGIPAEKAVLLRAADVREGMLLPTISGLKRVIEKKVVHYPVKYSIETKAGTVLASNVLTTSLCGDFINNGSRFLDTMKRYQRIHQSWQK